jgi:uncharacterized protein YndB with AHSA1/START domain
MVGAERLYDHGSRHRCAATRRLAVCHHGPDGVDYENRIVYEEIVKPERLVYSHPGGEDVEPVRIHVTVTFEDHEGKTKLTMLMLFSSAAERDRVIEKYDAGEGAKQTLARLAEHLATMG